MPHNTVYPLAAVRALALYTQGLTTPLGQEPNPTSEAIYNIVDRLRCIQIDTLQMVRRSRYLVVWSRIGCFTPGDFDRLIYDSTYRRLFEGWQHAASIIPLDVYRYQMPHQRQLQEHPNKWYQNWISEPGNAELMQSALERVRREGALRAGDFEYHGPKRGSWWDWKPAKTALEFLFAFGDLMIADRINFQRAYDLRERVMPLWVDTAEPTPVERDRFWLEQAVRTLGICLPAQVPGYANLKGSRAKPIIEDLIAEGIFLPVKATLYDGKEYNLIMHRDNDLLLEQAADGMILPVLTSFLSPFDNLFWARARDVQFWNFRNVLEAYKPGPTRTWGYFCLPILYHGRLVGRFDPRLERQTATLRLRALYLENETTPDEELVTAIAAAMRSFLAFHEASNLVIERSVPADFGDRLLRAI